MGMTSIPHGATVEFDVVTHHPATGAVQDADAPPNWKCLSHVSDTPNMTGAMTKRSGLTGHYKASFDLETINGFDPGDLFNVVVEATVAGVTAKAVVVALRVLAAETAAGKPAVDEASIADAVLSRDVSQVEAEAPEHSLCTVVLAALESTISSTEWIIKRTNGETIHVTKTVTTDANAEPITGVG